MRKSNGNSNGFSRNWKKTILDIASHFRTHFCRKKIWRKVFSRGIGNCTSRNAWRRSWSMIPRLRSRFKSTKRYYRTEFSGRVEFKIGLSRRLISWRRGWRSNHTTCKSITRRKWISFRRKSRITSIDKSGSWISWRINLSIKLRGTMLSSRWCTIVLWNPLSRTIADIARRIGTMNMKSLTLGNSSRVWWASTPIFRNASQLIIIIRRSLSDWRLRFRMICLKRELFSSIILNEITKLT